MGDTLDVGDNDNSRQDILSLVSKENAEFVHFNNNRVTLDAKKIKTDDQGAKLLSDLINSPKKFLYESTDLLRMRDKDGNKTTGFLHKPMASIPHGIVNASEFGKDANGEHLHRPRAGYDGQVVIHPDAGLIEAASSLDVPSHGIYLSDYMKEPPRYGSLVIVKPRSALIFHELAENYERTHNNVDYSGANGAHQKAIDRENTWSGRSLRPGMGLDVLKMSPPTKDQYKEMLKLINEY